MNTGQGNHNELKTEGAMQKLGIGGQNPK